MRRPVLLISAVACFVGAALTSGAGAAAPPGEAFLGYTLTAQAHGLQMTEDQPTATSHPEAEGEVPLSQVSLTSGPVGYALSTAAWPGSMAANLGSLLLLVAPNAPEQALLLNDPVRAEARTGTAQDDVTNADYPGLVMKAKATAADVSASAVADGGTAGQTAGVGRTTTASRALLDGDTARTVADSTAKDLELAGGVVRVGSVVSHAEASTDGLVATGSGATSVTGMTIAGVPVRVDDKGVTVDGTTTPIDPVAVATVNQALTGLNMTIALSSPSQTRDGGSITYDAGSLIVLWKPPGSASSIAAFLGGARVVAAATRAEAFVAPPVTPPVTPPAAPVVPPVTDPAPAPPGEPVSGGSPDLGAPPVPVAEGLPPQAAPPAEPVVAAPVAVVPAALEDLSVPGLPVLLTVLGGVLALGGLLRLPAFYVPLPAATPCPLEEGA